MAKLIILGTANAVADENHENTHMVLTTGSRTILIDCVGSPIVRLYKAGIRLESITDLILTHFHPDHVSGAPLLLMDMWLKGRKSPLYVYGLDYTLKRIQNLMEFYSWNNWPGFFKVIFHTVPDAEWQTVLQDNEVHLISSPVRHLIPNIGLRMEFLQSNRILTYSCDTEPCDQVVRLAKNADILIHEATGEGKGHSSAAQAGKIAAQAGAKHLYLIHYPNGGVDYHSMVADARQNFGRTEVTLTHDFLEVVL